MERPVVVIGGGIVGTAVAHELQLAGVATVLVERDVDPQGASAFSFASLSSFDEVQRDVYLLKSHGMIGWRRWAALYGDDLGLRFPGEIRWAGSTEAARFLMQVAQRAESRGYPVRFISDDDLKTLVPASDLKGTLVTTYAPDDGQADPIRAIARLMRAFTDQGGEVRVGRGALQIEESGITVRIGDDRVGASTVIVAAGAETAALFERLGWDVPMDPSPGLLCVTEPVEAFLDRTFYVYPAADTPVHMRQLPDGRVLIGERSQDKTATNPTKEHAQALLAQAAHAFPILRDTHVDHFTVEWRPMPRDKMPIVGPLPGLPDLYVATGHSGVTIAPALAEFIAKEITEGVEHDRLKPFRPARFAARNADAYASIAEAFSI